MTDTNTANDAGKEKSTTANVTDTAKTDNAAENATQFDTKSIPDDQFGKVFEDPRLFQHSRFKELNEKAKKATEYEKAQTDAQKQKLADEKKFEELLTLERKEKEDLQSKLQATTLDSAIQTAAAKAGSVDPAVVAKLIDRSLLKIGEDGSIQGLDEAVASLLKASPYLVGKPNANLKIGDGANPGNNENRITKFKLSDIQKMTPREFAKIEKDFNEAQKAGQVVDDIGFSIPKQAVK